MSELEKKLVSAVNVVNCFKDSVTKIFNAKTQKEFSECKIILAKQMTELEIIMRYVEFADLPLSHYIDKSVC